MKSNEITMLDSDFKKIIKNIKEEIINTQIKTVQVVNSNLILLYFRLGKYYMTIINMVINLLKK